MGSLGLPSVSEDSGRHPQSKELDLGHLTSPFNIALP